MPETEDIAKPYAHYVCSNLYVLLKKLRAVTFLLKGSALQILFGISEFPALLLLHFEAIIQGYLNTDCDTAAVGLITEMPTEWVGSAHSMDTLHKGSSHIVSSLEQDCVRLHPTAQNM